MHATQPQGGACPEPTRRFDGGPETGTDRRYFDLCQSDDAAEVYGQTELDHDRLPTTDGFIAWCARQATAVEGYVVTESGLHALTDAETGEEPVTARRVLQSAALYLERHGWIQGAYYDATTGSFLPPACLVGAIGMVCYGGPVDAPAQHFDNPGFLDFEEAVLHLDRYLLIEDGSESYEFNDTKGRTLQQVTHALREAADTPAEELIDAIRAINAKNTETAETAKLLIPRRIWGEDGITECPDCGRHVPVIDGRLATHVPHPGTPADSCVSGDPVLLGGDGR
ncbi:hypothetical protein [Krasilnikovia sp. M28-CT-15]|uniref:DUF6197 family protein n=1 Tax=Krasilnikovia sp. M28-CT-15 TaxID=3373540 RepID=UPI003876585B